MTSGCSTVDGVFREFNSGLGHLYPTQEIRSIVYWLFEEYLGLSRTGIHIEPGRATGSEAADKFDSALKLLSRGCPVQYITGYARFNGLKIAVSPAVLIPRPETEELTMLIRDSLKEKATNGLELLDIGTGSGCIAVCLKKELPGIRMWATDISADALEVASANARVSGAMVNFYLSDILNPGLYPFPKKLDLIVSNPPYVRESEKPAMHINVKSFEPPGALFVNDGDPLVYYRAIAGYGNEHLEKGGQLWLEINEVFGKEVASLLASNNYSGIRIMKDFRGKDRFVRAEFRVP